jgi:sugar phosphate isomerase/epimerase
MRKLLVTKNIQAVASLNVSKLATAGALAKEFRGVELDFSDTISEKGSQNAIKACGQAGLDVRSVHLPSLVRLSRMIGSKKVPEPLLDLTDTVFVIHAWLKDDERGLEDINRLAEKLGRNSNRLVVENLSNPKKIFSTPREVRDFFSREQRVGFCLDTSHPRMGFNQTTTDTIMSFVEAAGTNLAHVHLSDSDLSAGKKHLALGRGKLDLEPFFKALRSNGYSGLLALEIDDATVQDYRESLRILSGYGVSLDPNDMVSMLSAISAQQAVASLAAFTGEQNQSLALILEGKQEFMRYLDERNCIIFFDKSGTEIAPLLGNLDFPKQLPEGAGFFAIVRTPLRMEALYFNRSEKIALKRTLGHIYMSSNPNGIQLLCEDIENARRLAFGSGSVIRMKDGLII